MELPPEIVDLIFDFCFQELTLQEYGKMRTLTKYLSTKVQKSVIWLSSTKPVSIEYLQNLSKLDKFDGIVTLDMSENMSGENIYDCAEEIIAFIYKVRVSTIKVMIEWRMWVPLKRMLGDLFDDVLSNQSGKKAIDVTIKCRQKNSTIYYQGNVTYKLQLQCTAN